MTLHFQVPESLMKERRSGAQDKSNAGKFHSVYTVLTRVNERISPTKCLQLLVHNTPLSVYRLVKAGPMIDV